MKITIINLKQTIKYIFIFLTIIMMLGTIKRHMTKGIDIKPIAFVQCLSYELPIINSTTEIMSKEREKLSISILSTQIGVLKSTNKKNNEVQVLAPLQDELQIESTITQQEQMAITEDEKKETKILEDKNINAACTNEFNGIEINNQTEYDIADIMQNATYTCKNKNKVLIYHTHTCESYTATEQYNYVMTDSYRTTDLNYTVSRVGDELQSHLEKYNFNVVHDKTYHDYPSYSGSYGRSLKTLQNMLSANSDAEITIDLHRDAVGSMSDYAPRVQIGEETCAQVMFVIGTDGSGLAHNNWQENLKFAMTVQQKANELYPGLFRPIILRNARYNQHLTTASIIIEVGATGNTLEECLNSMKYLAEVFNYAIN